jgi:plasmid rolling circle replication initiator protein Rep
MSILYQDLPVVYDTGEILEDKTDWQKLKLKSAAVSKSMGMTVSSNQSALLKRSVVMDGCGARLTFACDRCNNKRLISAWFCKDRMCPACQKRRSLIVFHQVKDVCLSLQKEFKSTQYLLLTLTIPNVPIEELKHSMSTMNKAWTKMAKRAEVKKAVWGWFKALEVTCSSRSEKSSSYHPHFHILLAVPGNYFKGRNYITQGRWLELWQESMKMPEITQVDVRKVKPNPKKENSTAIESAAAEVGKYATKPANYLMKFQDDYIANGPVIDDLAIALRGAKLTSFGGRMKEHYSKLGLEDVESDNVDMVHVSGDSSLVEAVMIQVYSWNVGLKRYVN